MTRSTNHEALVLSVRPSGESNREALFLTEDSGLMRATVFGGPKSHLRAYVAPYNGGELLIYCDPVKDYRKVSDFNVRQWRPGIRESLERSYAAAAVAETVIAGYGGGGSWKEALALCRETLDAVDIATEEACRTALLRFLWKWAEILGARPDLDVCGDCACTPAGDEVVWYSRRESAVLCRRCADRKENADAIAIGPGARAWLRAIDRIDAKAALRIGADTISFRQAREAVITAAADAVGSRLKTWNALGGT
ncbi:MAG: DNA repair protein RecO C-terminal domain-containing protein [Treponemataceae bacterium]